MEARKVVFAGHRRTVPISVREPLRVRAGRVPDNVIKELEAFVCTRVQPAVAVPARALPAPLPKAVGGAA